MIDPGIWTSAQFMSLTIRQRLIFVGLISNSDDEGRLRGEAVKIKALLFPSDNISVSKVDADLRIITKIGLINRWQENGEIFIELPKWEKYQRVDKPKSSLIPKYSPTYPRLIQDESPTPPAKGMEGNGKERKEIKNSEKIENPKLSANAESQKISLKSEKQKNHQSKIECLRHEISTLLLIPEIKVEFSKVGKVLELVDGDLNQAIGAVWIFRQNRHNKEFLLQTPEEKVTGLIKWINGETHKDPPDQKWIAWFEEGFKKYNKTQGVPNSVGQILGKIANP